MGDVWLFYRALFNETSWDFRERIIRAGQRVEAGCSAGITVVFDELHDTSISAVVITAAADMEAAKNVMVSAVGVPFRSITPDYTPIQKGDDYYIRTVYKMLEELKQPNREEALTNNGCLHMPFGFSRN